jgi:ATPase subunit of ABC transporter with duplicated ATPase domains
MTLITLRSLGVTYAEPLFSDLNITIGRGDRIGLVAANGRGKSTLLRIIAGLAESTTGDVTRARGLRIGLVEQEIPAALLTKTLRDAVLSGLSEAQAEEESWRADIALDDLDIPADLRDRDLGSLSGGWQRMAMLTRAWVTEPDALLMDEPTNHLDLDRIGRLQAWLGALPRDFPLLIASHDRAFLDQVTNRTMFLRAVRTEVFKLPYTKARAALTEADEAEDRKFQNDIRQANQLRRQAAKLKNIGINSGSDLLVVKTKQLTERADKIEEAARPAHADRSSGAIRLGNSGSHAKALITLDDATVRAPDGRALFQTGKVWIGPDDRIVLLGPNGCGKSQLVGMIHRAIMGETGQVRAAPSIVLGASDQELTQLARDRTPFEAVTRRFDVGDQKATALLAGAGMSIDMQQGPISALSGGQKARLAMLVLRLEKPNFYLLDEPTNHLDIEGQEALERELTAYGASCLLVSHDRSFVRAVGNRFWQIQRKRLVEVDGPEAYFEAVLSGVM